jgi:hypothetical protein
MNKRWILGVSLATSLVLGAEAQELPPTAPTKEQLATNNKLFIELATKHLKRDEPAEPVRIVGPLYFVGTQGLSSWLFATGEGHRPDVGPFSTPVSPLPEQDRVVSVIRRQPARLDALVTNVRAAVERLKERRTALISAAVTGKIDVREEADT